MSITRYRLERRLPNGNVDIRYRATREAARELVQRWERESPIADISVLVEVLRITHEQGRRHETGSL